MWPKKHQPDGEKAMGDSYNNSGNNFGHMGPVNIGRQQFNFTPQIAQEILDKVPRDSPIDFRVIGSERSASVAQEIMEFMKLNNYAVGNVTRIGVIAPPPSGPLTFDGRILTIAADL